MLARTALRARILRKDLTPAEQTLWQALRGGALDGLKFRRQHPVDRYIADFACVSLKLAIEVDGGVHNEDAQTLYDLTRTEEIETRGWRVIRFTNAEVMGNLDRVLIAIRDEVRLGRSS